MRTSLIGALLAAGVCGLGGCGGGAGKQSMTASGGNTAASSSTAAAPPAGDTDPAAATGSGATPTDGNATTTSASAGSAAPAAAAPPSSPIPIPAGATVVSAIQQMPQWAFCTATMNGSPCASGLGNAVSSMVENQSTPSLDGASSQFSISGNVGYSNALWWKQLNPAPGATHFLYDFWVYTDQPSLPQALEFDMNQKVNTSKYIFGSECNFKGTGKWDVWDGKSGSWKPSTVDCVEFQPGSWTHIVWNLERTAQDQVHYIDITINGTTWPVEMYLDPQNSGNGSELNVAVQLDGDSGQQAYSIWVDEVTLTYW